MSLKKQIALTMMAIMIAISAGFAQQKHALIIGGNYEPGSEIPIGDRWNNGDDMGPDGYDEFWNDTYLMWELLYDGGLGYDNGNIDVLFADGVDYAPDGQHDRYKSLPNYPIIPSITDGAATKANVMAVLDGLANMQEEDYLFIWIMSNGGKTDPADNEWSYVYLWGYDPANPNEGRMYDYELKAKLDLIPAHKKVVVVQAPHSGGFAAALADESTIIFTSSPTSGPAIRADDSPFQENETWGGTEYHHGEFGFHFYSPLNGEDLGYQDLQSVKKYFIKKHINND